MVLALIFAALSTWFMGVDFTKVLEYRDAWYVALYGVCFLPSPFLLCLSMYIIYVSHKHKIPIVLSLLHLVLFVAALFGFGFTTS
jgi:hypothetical protein